MLLDIMENDNCGQMQQMRLRTFTYKLDLNSINIAYYCL
jgi:hypothetical protein